MILTNPPALLALLVLPVLWFIAWRGWAIMAASGRVVAVVTRTLIVSLLATALAGPLVPLPREGVNVVFAVDESTSMSEEMRREAERWTQRSLQAMGGRDAAAVITFGRDPQVQRGLSDVPAHTFQSATADETSTSFERVLRVSRSLLSNTTGRRVVLLTDGSETAGDSRLEARNAAAEGIEIDFVPIKREATLPEVLVVSFEAPSSIRDGDDFDLVATVHSTVRQSGILRLWLDGKGVGQQQVELEAGTTRLTIAQPPLTTGYHAFRLTIEATQDVQVGNNLAYATVVVREKARVLVIEQKDGDAKVVTAALQAAGMDVDVRAPKAIPGVLSGLRDYQSLILYDVPSSALTLDQMKTVEQFVQTLGRGLVAIGGSQAFGLGDYGGTPVEAALPVSMDIPPRDDKPSVALLLIIDKSGSMDYGGRDGPNKMAMAREAAVLATEELDPSDQVGVVAFDDTYRWTVPFQTIGAGASREAVKQKIQSIQAGGGTEIFPSLQAGYVALRNRTAQLRHIILLTDGKSFTGGDYDTLVERMRNEQITLSTVGIGNDTDEALLKTLAAKGKGRYNLTTDAKKIPQIVTRETKIASKNPIVESRFNAQIGDISPILRGFKPEDLPALKGYVVTTPKPTAQRVLLSPSGDPVLAKWQYGLGRAVAWTPDLRDRWSADWLTWAGYPKFLAQMVRWSMPDPANRNLQPTVSFDGEEATMTVEASEDDGTYIDLAPIAATVTAADGARRQLQLRQVAPGRYETRFTPGPTGAYRLDLAQARSAGRVVQDMAGFTVPYPAELRAATASPALLHELARVSGGRQLLEPADAFRPSSVTTARSPYPIWGWLLLAAALLLPIEIAARRGFLGTLWRRDGWRQFHLRRRADD